MHLFFLVIPLVLLLIDDHRSSKIKAIISITALVSFFTRELFSHRIGSIYYFDEIVSRFLYITALAIDLIGMILVLYIFSTGMRKVQNMLHELTITDVLTQISNRRNLMRFLEEVFLRAKRYHYPFCLIMIDVDYFKKVNDQYGHDIGDIVLIELAYTLNTSVRNIDMAGRFGGEEFCIILPDTDKKEAISVAERIRKTVEGHVINTPTGEKIKITISLGLSFMKEGYRNMDELLRDADQALYRAKDLGRNQSNWDQS
jgi:diguanylate cyclase (GGDEF)-like protein